MDENPKRRWFDQQIGAGSIAEWAGMAMVIVGASGAIGASELSQRMALTWSPVAWLICLPVFLIGCALLVWATRRKQKPL